MAKQEDKRELREVITTFDEYFFEQDFSQLALFFSDTKRFFSENLNYKYLEDKVNKYDSFKIEHDYRYERYDDNRYSEFIFYGKRLETDEELNKRLENIKEEEELALFEKLKKKYGK